jgi:hypothetical protein
MYEIAPHYMAENGKITMRENNKMIDTYKINHP